MYKNRKHSSISSCKSDSSISTLDVRYGKLRSKSYHGPFVSPFSYTITLSNGEKFKPSGDFEKDFTDLCGLVGITSLCVRSRPKRPNTAMISPPDTSMSKGSKEDKKTSANQTQEVVKTTDGDQPTTFVVSNNIYEYLKPRMEVEIEEEGNKSHVKELYIRGWQLDKKVIEILTITMPELDRLTVIDFWNVGLNDETLLSLGHCLSMSTTLKTLRLDGNNHTTEERFDVFISEKSIIQNLSLKNCALTDKAALLLSNSLLENKSLLSLNLCFNKLTNEGATHIAKGIRMNRTLLSLNLASNNISDEGAIKFSEALSKFPLTHEQVVARRLLKSSTVGRDDMYISPIHSNALDSPPAGSRSFNKDEKKQKGGSKKKDSTNNKLKEISVKRGPSNIDANKTQKGQKIKVPVKQDRIKTPQQEMEGYEFKNPLLEKVQELNGELWIPGNRSLINLNLARNNIGDSGVASLFAAMKYQVDLANETNRNICTGLMRLSLQKNAFSPDHPIYMQLSDLMKTRDPFYKAPSPSEEGNKEDQQILQTPLK